MADNSKLIAKYKAQMAELEQKFEAIKQKRLEIAELERQCQEEQFRLQGEYRCLDTLLANKDL